MGDEYYYSYVRNMSIVIKIKVKKKIKKKIERSIYFTLSIYFNFKKGRKYKIHSNVKQYL